MKVKIPTAIVNKIRTAICSDLSFIDLTEKQYQRLFKTLLELWLFIYNKQVEDIDTNNLKLYTNIDSKDLSVFIFKVNGKNIKYNQLLITIQDLIDVNQKYSAGAGGFYKGYRIKTEFLCESNFTEMELDMDKVFHNSRDKSFWIKKYPNHQHLINDAYDCSVDLDSYLDWMQNNRGSELQPVYNKRSKMIEKRYLTNDVMNFHLLLATKVNCKNLWFKVSDEGRFYSSISNLPKGSIHFLKMNYQSVVSIDLKNCQPLLLSSIIYHPKFKVDCEFGRFYDVLVEQNHLGGGFSNLSRGVVKQMFYRFLFFGDNQLKSGKFYDLVEQSYPGLINIVNEIKSSTKLYSKLQRLESNLFVDRLGHLPIKKLIRHDEILVADEHKDLVVKCLLIELKKDNVNLKYKII